MIVLGFDTATPATAVGLMLANGSTLQARDDPAGEQRPGHATRLLPLVDGLLAEAGLDWSELERIAVGVGPGTFTGLRIGIATARGLAQSLGLRLVGVSSLRALAHAAGEQTSKATGVAQPSADANGSAAPFGDVVPGGGANVLAVIDARRGEVFVGGYDGEQEVLAPQAVSPDGLSELLERAAIHTDAERWIAVGNGAVLYRDAFERVGVSVLGDRSECHMIHASAICDLGARLPESTWVAAVPVVPDYRRRPDAEVALEGAS